MVRPRRRALTASGMLLRLDDEKTLASYRRRSQITTWQPKAWVYNDLVPELGESHDYVRNALSRVRIFAGTREEPDEEPTPLADSTLSAVADDADEALQRLEPLTDLMGDVAYNLDINGECHVVLLPDDEEPDGERCIVLSTLAFEAHQSQWRYREDGGPWLDIPAEATVFRIWTHSGEYRQVATAPMKRLIGIAEELAILTQYIRGTALSRLAFNGILGIADELTLQAVPHTDDGTPTEDAGDGELDPFVEDLIVAASAAIQDPTSAAAALPIVVRGPGEWIEKGISFTEAPRPFDPVAASQRAELLGRIANGLDLPREIVLGIGSTNHWNTAQIDEQTWRVHLDPRARRIVSAITRAYLRPMLAEGGTNPEIVRRIDVWFDPTDLFGDPDQSDTAIPAYDALLISGEAGRRALRFSEDDAPSDEEIAQRLEIERAKFGMGTVGEGEPESEQPPVRPTDDTEEDEQAPQAIAVAAAGARTYGRLGRQLVGIERDLRARLQIEASNAVSRTLERAGSMARNRLQRLSNSRREGHTLPPRASAQNAALVEQLAGVRTDQVPATLGVAVWATLGLADEELLSGALADLHTRYGVLVSRAQRAAIAAAARATQRSFAIDPDEATVADRDAGWLILAAGLAALAHDRMFDPHPAAPPFGEFDDTLAVPAGLVRTSLDRAGGAQVTDTPDGPRTVESASPGPGGAPAAGGATAGPSMLDLFREQLGIVAEGYTWVYGPTQRRTFEPHLDLDGTTFGAWDDEALFAELGTFPYVTHYRPGDHRGCQCDFAVTFSQSEE